ncbi:MAG: hypothetical protein A2504_07535 [Bdellovibrionales bacterium RIFOXYD12_FULL_39_22]|nr:MAG: hypothetical protein A2385_13805 [Bdellovibrionales bacterium RIFOXYB1_FULL_39_21]OFZ48961.1 MAG: hypothetical protein A2404_09570 [Bdellovibrionales bacterium RIFOXYC1_FULL_39_130]OFZ72943.1 MAG: hypothetical protein A2451_02040 [Bdellovibrionales bacterium RIFOXYC2_FULL_39_8]OFZ76948.1 MAG: hypothetical protein A2560_16570 [Bdellovibrionales bacterium RIFOXYD1_FULL_39_84]OFZ96019.1 MAG: hypothetical protein A2504_07535 [Bdellovibrionales bacterium RIFOXYD12_FULL_39_22]
MKKAEIVFTKRAMKEIEKLPKNIVEALMIWTFSVEEVGIHEVRKIRGYHDEPLHGDRQGQRSVRLSRAYRVFYSIAENGEIEIITVLEVNKHRY